MLAAHQDQENQVFSQPAGAAAKQSFQSKAPGARYPKTPLKVPLSDDNAARVFAGKSIIKTANNNENLTTIGRGAKGKNNIVTPLEPRTARAPLGNKTTNAKARAGQPAGVKDIVQPMEKSQTKATPAPRSRNGPSKVERLRLEVHGDKDPLEEEEDVEYAPPPVKAKPYESDLVPAHLLTFKGLKRENMLKGYYEHYYQDFDENGMSVKERELEEQRRRALQKGEEQICQDTENMNWSVSDVPESNDYFKKRQGDKHAAEGMFETRSVSSVSKPKPVSLMAARKAAAALSMPSQSTASARAKTSKPRPPLSLANKTNVTFGFPGSKQPRKPTVSRMSSAELAPALAASRSTIGYNKGRSALGTFHARGTSSKTSSATANRPGGPHKARTISRSVSTASTRSDNTITPARFAQSQAVKEEDLKKLEFLSIFDVDEESSGDLGEIPPFDNLDEVFELQTNF